MEREEKQGTYFPVYPNLRAQVENRERERRKVGEETRASYCD